MGFKLVIKKGDARCAKCGKPLQGPWWGEDAVSYCGPRCSGPTEPYPAPRRKR